MNVDFPYHFDARGRTAEVDYDAHIREASDLYQIPETLIRAVIKVESDYDPRVVSSANARGVMQVTRQTWSYVEMVLLGHKVRHGKDGNIHVGVAYLRQLLHEFHFNVRLAVGAYNQGPAAVRAHGLYPKTRKFVANVLALRRRFS